MRQRISFVFIVAIVILAMVVVEATGEEAEPFSFRNGITFGMSIEEIKEIEEVQNHLDPEKWRTSFEYGWTVLTMDEKVRISQYTGEIVYFFNNDMMQSALYMVTTEDIDEVYQGITKALSSIYGDCEDVDQNQIESMIKFFTPVHYLSLSEGKKWIDKKVIVYQYKTRKTKFYIQYLNPAFDYPNPPIDVTGL